MNGPPPRSVPSLTEATVQEIQLELIRRRRFNEFNGERVFACLVAHRELWEAVMMDRYGFLGNGPLPELGLIKLHDLSNDLWNVDTLYILARDVPAARQIAALFEAEDWGAMVHVYEDQDIVDRALGTRYSPPLVTAWWD